MIGMTVERVLRLAVQEGAITEDEAAEALWNLRLTRSPTGEWCGGARLREAHGWLGIRPPRRLGVDNDDDGER